MGAIFQIGGYSASRLQILQLTSLRCIRAFSMHEDSWSRGYTNLPAVGSLLVMRHARLCASSHLTPYMQASTCSLLELVSSALLWDIRRRSASHISCHFGAAYCEDSEITLPRASGYHKFTPRLRLTMILIVNPDSIIMLSTSIAKLKGSLASHGRTFVIMQAFYPTRYLELLFTALTFRACVHPPFRFN